MVSQAEGMDVAVMWFKIGFLWPFTVALLFHFILIFTEKTKLFSNKLVVFLIYAPAAFFSFLELTTNLVSGELVKGTWGYTYNIQETSFLFWIGSTWLFTLAIFGLVLSLRYCSKVTNTKKTQAKFVSFGFSIPLFSSLISQVYPILSEIQIPDFSVISTTALCVFVGYAIWKHNLFLLNPITAAENIISTMPDGLILVDVEGKIISTNKSMLNLLNYSESELLEKPIDLLLENKNFSIERLEKMDRNGLKNYEITFKPKTGNTIPVNISASLIRDKEGKTQGAVAIVRDITEKKKMENLLVASEKMAAIGQAATMVGHDLRNPLQAIGNAAHCITKEVTSLGTANPVLKNSLNMLKIIQKSIDYANNIVLDLKDFSSERKPDIKKTDLNELIKDALQQCKTPNNVKTITKLEAIPPLNVDRYMMKRVFVNIVTNSMQAMKKTGGVLEVSTQKTDDSIKVYFKDTGVGMSKKTLKHLFTPFFTTKAQGMGMGLSISKKFVESNGGFIEVQSEDGKGTTFTVKFSDKKESL
jgi:PAS domain S-box-containing protein